MRPIVALDADIVARNASAWAAHSGARVCAVVKSQGYGWGYAAMVRALQGRVAEYAVADADELRDLRACTPSPAIVLGAVEPGRLAEVLDADALPTIAGQRELDIAGAWARARTRPLRVRVGVLPAAGWSGLALSELAAFAGPLAAANAEVQLWTHFTDGARYAAQLEEFERARRLLLGAGVRIVGTDVASTYSVAGGAPGDVVRIGVGLFGGGSAPGLKCALRVTAPVVRVERRQAGTPVGYGGMKLPAESEIVVARCGYGDGFPKTAAGADDILTVGMQYVTAHITRCDKNRTQVELLDGKSNLDAFAVHAGRLTHEIVIALGNAARANDVSIED
ncbi:MAG: alanine racemase [Candidatus Eremiobacteraeota bacterium]|nr:alanine racemase [Candidatus Eremiobacteraeota bacterium]